MYFRFTSSTNSFASAITPLPVAGRPAKPTFGIDYINEQTTELVPPTVLYSTLNDMSGFSVGSNSYLSLTPGTDIYFQIAATQSSFASEVQQLEVKIRPVPPVVQIDFDNVTSVLPYGDSIIYSTHADMSNSITGDGTPVKLNPGVDLYFQVAPTTNSFRSGSSHLSVPMRPSATTIGINYYSEQTDTVIPEMVEYAINAEMAGSTTGNDLPVALTPGVDMYFRVRSTDSSFASSIQHLIVPDNNGPDIGIDFRNGRTDAIIDSTILISANAAMIDSIFGSNDSVHLEPGHSYYFMQMATSNNFKSEVSSLYVPNRPQISIPKSSDNISSSLTLKIRFDGQVSGFGIDDILVSNGIASNLRDTFLVDIVGNISDSVYVQIPVNVVDQGNFESNRFGIKLTGSAIHSNVENQTIEHPVTVVPNPASNNVFIKIPGHIIKKVTLLPIVGTPITVGTNNYNQSEVFIDLPDIPQGTYYLIIRTETKILNLPLVIL
jgi:hypothetical protein